MPRSAASDLRPHCLPMSQSRFSSVFSFQIFNAARQLSHIEAAPDKSGLVLLDYWVGFETVPSYNS